jgi:hypothetical protein
MARTNPLGEIEWDKSFAELDDDVNSFDRTVDGGYIISGIVGDPVKLFVPGLLKTKSDGTGTWFKEFQKGSRNSIGAFVKTTADGGYIVVGTVDNQLYIAKLSRGKQVFQPFIRGDVNGDDNSDISDAVVTLEHLFLGGSEVKCLDAADSNDDGQVDISDPISTLTFLFIGGFILPFPYPDCGEDETPFDPLACEIPSC